MDELAIRHDARGARFLGEIEGHTAILEYHMLEGATVDFASTWVPDALRGRQVGTHLVLHALGWARGQGLKVRPSCWFVRSVVDRHAGYGDLLVA